MNGIYCGPPPLPGDMWALWNLDPVLIAVLTVAAAIFRRDPAGRLGVAVLVVAFVSPVCALSSALFSARVVHHVLLVAAAAPLFAWSLPPRGPGSIALPFIFATVVLWFWHVPVAYDIALSHQGVYWLMQLTLLGSAVLFWRSVFTDGRSPVDAMLFILAGFVQMGMLGALLTFAPAPLYEAHAVAPLAWGLTPLTDQQAGGLLMWVPAGGAYAVAAALVARRSWLRLKGEAG